MPWTFPVAWSTRTQLPALAVPPGHRYPLAVRALSLYVHISRISSCVNAERPGARLDLRFYFREGPKHRWLGVDVFDADGRQVGESLPIDRQEHIGPYFDDLAAKAYDVAAAKRTKPLQR